MSESMVYIVAAIITAGYAALVVAGLVALGIPGMFVHEVGHYLAAQLVRANPRPGWGKWGPCVKHDGEELKLHPLKLAFITAAGPAGGFFCWWVLKALGAGQWVFNGLPYGEMMLYLTFWAAGVAQLVWPSRHADGYRLVMRLVEWGRGLFHR